MLETKHKSISIIITFFLVIITFVSYSLYTSSHSLTTTSYTISSPELSHSFRIVQLTDLHDSVFGEGNSRLLAAVEDASPDVIFITGDLVNNKKGEDTSIATQLISDLCKIAPVYFSYGNQEDDLEQKEGVDITELYTEAGAKVLERDYLDTEIAGQEVRIGGIYGYCRVYPYAWEAGKEDETEYLKDFQDTDRYTLLMCHMPVCWLASNSLYDYHVDCVFSGHVHGGQIRLPFIGGLYAPDQGWFPGRECGVYTTNEKDWENYRDWALEYCKERGLDTSYYEDLTYESSNLVLSRGLGNTDWVPRFNNVPEVVVVDFEPKEQ